MSGKRPVELTIIVSTVNVQVYIGILDTYSIDRK